MIANVAIAVALVFVGGAVLRFAPGAPSRSRIALFAAIGAGVLGIAQWTVSHDSRWLVGAILLIGAAYPGWAARNRRALTIASLVMGVLGTLLYGIAWLLPMARPVAA